MGKSTERRQGQMTGYEEYEDSEEERPPDPAVEKASDRLRVFFEVSPSRLFYSTQIETSLEREIFHWITGKALLEQANAGLIQRKTTEVAGNAVNFYAHGKHRYWQREHSRMSRLLDRVFDPEFAQAIGRHGELMFDAALGRAGFRAEAQNTKKWNGVTWEQTNHNLDRILTKDGLAYGAEIKNTQNYISRKELRTKIQLCDHLGVIPLFIMRFAPKSYIYEVIQHGGFVLLFEEQMYPWGHSQLLRDVRETLGIKVNSPRDIKDGDIKRLLNWHSKRLTRP
jgi:hypothetical protein